MTADINRDGLVEFLEAIFSEGPEAYRLADSLENGYIPKGGVIILDECGDEIHSEPREDSHCSYARMRVQEWISKNIGSRRHLFDRNGKYTVDKY